MIRMNRTTEYGLIALRYMLAKRTQGDATVTSARELSDRYSLPFEITAKTLQKMKDTRLIQSAQGARGGYTLARELSTLSLAEFLEKMEGPQNVVGCAAADSSACACEYEKKCDVRGVMGDLNERVKSFLGGIFLTDLAEFKTALPASFRMEPASRMLAAHPESETKAV